MMLFLADINLLIALSDPGHASHPAARAWLVDHRQDGLATCAITENGFLRIFGHPDYPGGPGSPAQAMMSLHTYRQRVGHRFLPCDLSLDDRAVFPDLGGATPRQLTDLYLLALAGRHQARFATFDVGFPVDLVPGGAQFLERIPLS